MLKNLMGITQKKGQKLVYDEFSVLENNFEIKHSYNIDIHEQEDDFTKLVGQEGNDEVKTYIED